MKFLDKHPFVKSLVKLHLRIAVSFHTILWGLIVAAVLFGIVGAAAYAFVSEDTIETRATYAYGNQDSYNQLLSIKIGGTIVGDRDDMAGAYDPTITSGYDVKQQLYDAAELPDIYGVVLEINSPGGTIYGAHAIADGVKHYKEVTGQPVYAYIQGMGTSGAYWAAASTDKIFADYGSDSGGIGVLQGPFQYYNKPITDGSGVVTQDGIENIMITAGTSKDVGNPFRRLTQNEIDVLQKSVNNDYDLFVKYVSQQRKIPETKIRTEIGAFAYDNKTAQSFGLIDQTGSRQDAYEQLAKAADLPKDDFVVIQDNHFSEYYADQGMWISNLFGKKRQANTGNATKTTADLCTLSRTNMAYYGDVSTFCKQQ